STRRTVFSSVEHINHSGAALLPHRGAVQASERGPAPAGPVHGVLERAKSFVVAAEHHVGVMGQKLTGATPACCCGDPGLTARENAGIAADGELAKKLPKIKATLRLSNSTFAHIDPPGGSVFLSPRIGGRAVTLPLSLSSLMLLRRLHNSTRQRLRQRM